MKRYNFELYHRVNGVKMQNNKNTYSLPPTANSIVFPKLLYVSNVSEKEWSSALRVEHDHEHLEIDFVRSGSNIVMVGNNLYPVKAGDLIINNSKIIHDEQYGKSPISVYAIGIDDVRLQYLPPNHLVTEAESPIIHCQDCYDLVNNLSLTLFNSLKASTYEMNSSAHYALLTLLALVREKSTVTTEPTSNSAQQQLCKNVMGYISAHYLEDITLLDISDFANVSPYYMSRAFKKGTGFSPMQYVARLRLGKAQVLLIHTNMSIIDIAYESGYNNLSTFNSAFSKMMGMTPDKFRKTYNNFMAYN